MASLAARLPDYRVHVAQSGTMLMIELPAGTDTASIVAAARTAAC